MSDADSRRFAEAVDWVRRLADPDFDDWDAHLAWLEGDPLNAEAFDRASLLVEDAVAGLGSVQKAGHTAFAAAVNDNGPSRRLGRAAGWSAAAAALAAGLVAVVALRPDARPADGRYEVATASGQRRALDLADGTRLSLNASTRIELDRASPRSVRLVDGQAFFVVRHDAAHPFVVRTDEATFQDVGTSFDVARRARSTEVIVGDGAVSVDPAGSAVTLTAGHAMLIAQGGAVERAVDPESAGSWRTGRLVYADAPAWIVASDLARELGVPVEVDESLSARHFSGVIVLDGDRRRMFERIGIVMDVAVERNGHGWRLKRRR